MIASKGANAKHEINEIIKKKLIRVEPCVYFVYSNHHYRAGRDLFGSMHYSVVLCMMLGFGESHDRCVMASHTGCAQVKNNLPRVLF